VRLACGLAQVWLAHSGPVKENYTSPPRATQTSHTARALAEILYNNIDMRISKKAKISIFIISLIIICFIAFDLGFLREYGSNSYSVIRNLYCTVIKQKEYAHISPTSVYSSSGDYLYIYQCGDEYDRANPPG